MSCLQGHFTWIFSMKTLPDLSCIWKPIKWAFQNWSYMPKKSIFWGSYALLKFVHDKRKLDCFHQGNTEIFVFHKQILKSHNFLKRWTFWTCRTSFEKLISRAFRWKKDLLGFSLRKSKLKCPEDSPSLDDF